MTQPGEGGPVSRVLRGHECGVAWYGSVGMAGRGVPTAGGGWTPGQLCGACTGCGEGPRSHFIGARQQVEAGPDPSPPRDHLT